VFPTVKYVWVNTLNQQMDHVLSEVVEATQDLINGRLGDMDMEVMDIIHSCETLLRMREAKGIDLESVRKAVVEKNGYRGYYNVPEQSQKKPTP